ncbi:hypothetical protein Acsp07_03420 [Actinomycetospora sp. NBRC 106378]|nr:hypothetical protein Acsp07_03420 [Actinomycetospora sp. NBRC 106378]
MAELELLEAQDAGPELGGEAVQSGGAQPATPDDDGAIRVHDGLLLHLPRRDDSARVTARPPGYGAGSPGVPHRV